MFGELIGAGNDPSRLFIGYVIGGVIMIAGGIVEVLLGVAAQGKELEQVAPPLLVVAATQVPRAPLAQTQAAHSYPARVTDGGGRIEIWRAILALCSATLFAETAGSRHARLDVLSTSLTQSSGLPPSGSAFRK